MSDNYNITYSFILLYKKRRCNVASPFIRFDVSNKNVSISYIPYLSIISCLVLLRISYFLPTFVKASRAFSK